MRQSLVTPFPWIEPYHGKQSDPRCGLARNLANETAIETQVQLLIQSHTSHATADFGDKDRTRYYLP